MNGEVTIKKVFRDGREEIVAKDHNVITIGMGIDVVNVLTTNSTATVAEHLVGYYQVGTGDHNPDGKDPDYRKYIYNLKHPLTYDNYGEDTTLTLDNHDLLISTKNFTPDSQYTVERNTFAYLPTSHSTSIIDDTVTYRLTIDEESASGISITEFGLYSKNPDRQDKTDKSTMIAYKRLDTSDAIEKTAEFSVVVDWELKFVDAVEETPARAAPNQPNIVFIMADDLGIDSLGLYDHMNPYALSSADGTALGLPHSQIDRPLDGCGIYAHTPFLSAMANGGMTFFNARSNTMCSPTRAQILTGKYAFTSYGFNNGEGIFGHGIGTVTTPDADLYARGGLKGLNSQYEFYNKDADLTTLSQERGPIGSKYEGQQGRIHIQKTIAEYLEGTYHTGIIGKWHLAEWSETEIYDQYGSEGQITVMGDGWAHASSVGKFNDWRLYFHNLDRSPMPDPTPANMGYVSWIFNNNGEQKTVQDTDYVSFADSTTVPKYSQGDASSYATHYATQQSIDFCTTAEEPFFLYCPMNAPHAPQTYPPSGHVYNDYYNENHVQRIMQGDRTDMSQALAASSSWINFTAQAENLDNQISALYYGIPLERRNNTIFIFTGDNGTPLSVMEKINEFCSSGLAGNTTLTAKSAASGAGTVYNKWLNSEDHLTARYGGNKDTGQMFKSSVYERGVLVPMVVSGIGVESNVSSFAFVDLNDIFPTVLDIAGMLDENSKTDGYSFYSILKGDTDADNHSRQHSFVEAYRPIGNTQGNPLQSGVGNGDGDPTTPFERRRGLVVRANAATFGSTLIPGHVGTQEPVPEVSAGVWKLVRCTSGISYDELYHLRDNDFSPVDQWEMIDYLPVNAKYGANSNPYIIQNLLLSSIEHGDINDPNDYWWNLSKIYHTLFNYMGSWLSNRTEPSNSNLDILYADDVVEAKIQDRATENTQDAADEL